jgi:hypothetical protein
MQRVAKSSRFDLVIQASRTAVIIAQAKDPANKTLCGSETIARVLGEYRMPACPDTDGAKIHTAILK